jgi:hypothetical protein
MAELANALLLDEHPAAEYIPSIGKIAKVASSL